MLRLQQTPYQSPRNLAKSLFQVKLNVLVAEVHPLNRYLTLPNIFPILKVEKNADMNNFLNELISTLRTSMRRTPILWYMMSHTTTSSTT